MTRNNRPLNIALLALPDVAASTLHGMLDLFASAGRDWTFLTEGRIDQGAANPYIVTRGKAPLEALNGVTITPHYGLDDCPATRHHLRFGFLHCAARKLLRPV